MHRTVATALSMAALTTLMLTGCSSSEGEPDGTHNEGVQEEAAATPFPGGINVTVSGNSATCFLTESPDSADKALSGAPTGVMTIDVNGTTNSFDTETRSWEKEEDTPPISWTVTDGDDLLVRSDSPLEGADVTCSFQSHDGATALEPAVNDAGVSTDLEVIRENLGDYENVVCRTVNSAGTATPVDGTYILTLNGNEYTYDNTSGASLNEETDDGLAVTAGPGNAPSVSTLPGGTLDAEAFRCGFESADGEVSLEKGVNE
ncbi:MAG: hypothetical protein ACTHWB_10875 [Microbacterium gubbeenense]|uniref:hypothetical protein n=1 Tax=Microbacterium TaxID=33882 RepID=UPI003F9AD7E9